MRLISRPVKCSRQQPPTAPPRAHVECVTLIIRLRRNDNPATPYVGALTAVVSNGVAELKTAIMRDGEPFDAYRIPIGRVLRRYGVWRVWWERHDAAGNKLPPVSFRIDAARGHWDEKG